jgi:DNA-binding response OmpR family regulator
MKETILLIEDEVELQQNLKEILEYKGFSVFTADNGQDALIKIENQKIDVILCDIMMPIIDGFQFLKIIRNQGRFQEIPFIFLSAKASEDDKSEGLLEGSDDYLTKPISARILMDAIFEVLEKKNHKD